MSKAAALVLCSALALVTCGGSNDASVAGPAELSKPDQTAATGAALPNCADLFADGTVVEGLDEASPSCLNPDGDTQVLGAFRCADGTHLVTVDKRSGSPSAGWYLTGQAFHAVAEVVADPAYSEAYTTCNQ